MKKIKNIIAILLALAMCTSLVACQKNTNQSPTSGVETTTVADATSAETTEEETTAGILMPAPADQSQINSIIPGKVTVDGTNFVVNDKIIFMNGANTPWKSWNDFGGSFSKSYWNDHFKELHEAGVNAVRVWISCNGTSGMGIKPDGNFIAATPKHWTDLDKLFEAAEKNGIYIMATLMSFDHFKKSNSNAMAWASLLGSEAKMDTYINNYLIPFCKRYDSYNSLWSIDLCNEPDWINENDECGKLAWSKITKFFAKEAAAIHENSDILVTIGFGMIKYNSTKYTANYGSDASLQKAFKSDKAYLDFYSPHFYEWEAQWYGFPFDKTPVDFGLDGTKPMVIGEFPASGFTGIPAGSQEMTATQCYINAYNYGWNGIFAWTSNGVDDCGSLADFIDGVKEVARLENNK